MAHEAVAAGEQNVPSGVPSIPLVNVCPALDQNHWTVVPTGTVRVAGKKVWGALLGPTRTEDVGVAVLAGMAAEHPQPSAQPRTTSDAASRLTP